MTKTCVVCKKYAVSGDNTRSFHKFPINEDVKKQWMDATGVSKLTVNCTVCSDHFTPQSYHNTDGYGTLKRLLRNAVPIVNRPEAHSIEECTAESNVNEMKTIVNEENSDLGEKKSSTSPKNHDISNRIDDFDDRSCSNDSSTNSLNEKIDIDRVNNKLKRNITTSNTKALDIKRMFRFRDGMETKYICREEFVTEEAWDKFLRLMLLNRKRMEGLRQRISRRKRMINSGQNIKETVKPEDCNPERFLQIILKE